MTLDPTWESAKRAYSLPPTTGQLSRIEQGENVPMTVFWRGPDWRDPDAEHGSVDETGFRSIYGSTEFWRAVLEVLGKHGKGSDEHTVAQGIWHALGGASSKG